MGSSLAKRIKQYRHLAKMTQEVLAEKAGISETYIRKLEAGERTPSLQILLDIAYALKTTPDHLILSTPVIASTQDNSIINLLGDCTPTEFAILYENMAELKRLLRKHIH